MKHTPNLNLYEPDINDDVEIDKSLAENFKKIDEAHKQTTAQLAQRPKKDEARLKTEKLELEDMSPTTLAAIEGGEGTTFNLMSIPQPNSVSEDKLSPQLRKDLTTPLTNIVANGNFVDKSGWQPNNATFTVAENEAIISITATSASTGLIRGVPAPPEHKLYISAYIKPKYVNNILFGFSGANRIVTNEVKPNEYNRIKGVVTKGESNSLTIYHDTYHGDKYVVGDTFNIKNVLAIDLTDTFGYGNEPTEEELDSLLEKYPEFWFDGTINFMTMKDVYRKLEQITNSTLEITSFLTVENQDWEVE